jgi:hypothetical protein
MSQQTHDDPAGVVPGFEWPADDSPQAPPEVSHPPLTVPSTVTKDASKGIRGRVGSTKKKDKAVAGTSSLRFPQSRRRFRALGRKFQPFLETTFVELDAPAGAAAVTLTTVAFLLGLRTGVLPIAEGIGLGLVVVLLFGAILHQHYEHGHLPSLGRMIVLAIAVGVVIWQAKSYGLFSNLLYGIALWHVIPGFAVKMRESQIATRRRLQEEATMSRRTSELNAREAKLERGEAKLEERERMTLSTLTGVENSLDRVGSAAASINSAVTNFKTMVSTRVDAEVAERVEAIEQDAKKTLEEARDRMRQQLVELTAAPEAEIRELKAQVEVLQRDNNELRQELEQFGPPSDVPPASQTTVSNATGEPIADPRRQ